MRTRLLRVARYFKNSEDPGKQRVYQSARSTYRWTGRNVSWLGHFGWTSSLRSARWDGNDLVIEGWAYHRGTDLGDEPEYRIWLVSGTTRIELEAEQITNLDIRGAARAAEYDYSSNAFRARVPEAVLNELPAKNFRIVAQVSGDGHRITGPVSVAYRLGGAGLTPMRELADGSLAGPSVQERTFRVGRWLPKARASDVELVANGTVTIHLEDADEPVEVAPDFVIDEVDPHRPKALISVPKDGRHVPVHTTQLNASGGFVARPDQRGRLEVVRADAPIMIESVELDTSVADAPCLRLTGRALAQARPQLSLASAHVEVRGEIEWCDDGTFHARMPLTASRWGGPELPLPTGLYVARTDVDSAFNSTFLEVAAADFSVHSLPQFRIRLGCNGDDELAISITRPRAITEYGSSKQRELRRKYTDHSIQPLEAVYFESFFGRNATCNPRAIDAEIARRRPDLPRYWAVSDLSIEVPEGAVPLVRGTTDWWRVRSSAKWVVTNEWLRQSFVKKDFQTVMQTWHGSMYKRIGLDRDGMGLAHIQTLHNERQNWDLFISQAPVTTPIIKRAYDMPDGVIEIGYPRNDELSVIDPERDARTRERLGVRPDAKLVMYAPTWREPGQDVDLLDLPDLSEQLGADVVFLNRGHVRTLDQSRAVRSEGVIDVSTYPHINDLYRVADLLITDYSSMMFDFSVTGRPMVFFTPDIDQYTNAKVRGSYFDLEDWAPGPVTKSVSDVVRLIETLDQWPVSFAQKYERWQAQYNSLDDGQASSRAVEALFSHVPGGAR